MLDNQTHSNVASLAKRAQNLKLLITDCDGVLTDGCVYVSERGEEFKRFNLKDGMGVHRLTQENISCALMTREKTEFPLRRAEKLKLPFVYLGIQDKAKHLEIVVKETGFTPDQMAYIGDDINDLEIMQIISKQGLTGCPSDSIREIIQVANYRCEKPGGAGAFREFAEWLINLRRPL